jgi:hypothetical protein
MVEAARRIDVLDTSARFTAADAEALNARFAGVATQEMLAAVLREGLAGRIAAVSSFGAESAVLLHLIASIDPSVPVLFLETGKHFPETLAYRDEITARLGLTNLINLTPDPALLAKRDESGLRWSYDPDGCCEIRKVLPLAGALAGFDASFTGRKGFQSATRAGLPVRTRYDRRAWAGSRSIRWPTGQATRSRATSPPPACPRTRWWRKAIPRSVARPAPAWSHRAKMPAPAAGRAGTRPNAASTSMALLKLCHRATIRRSRADRRETD